MRDVSGPIIWHISIDPRALCPRHGVGGGPSLPLPRLSSQRRSPLTPRPLGIGKRHARLQNLRLGMVPTACNHSVSMAARWAPIIVGLVGIGLAPRSAAFVASPLHLRHPHACGARWGSWGWGCQGGRQRRRSAGLVGGQAGPAGRQAGLLVRRETLGTRAARTLPRPGSDLDRRITRVLLPCALSFLVVPLTNAVDTAWIGRMGDALALAGQGAANQVFSTAFFLISFLPTVMAPLVASAVGAGDRARARARIGETLFLASFLGALGTIALSLYPSICLRIVLAPDSPAIEPAQSYLWVRALSLLPALWGSVGFAALRGAQDTRTPLKISAGSNLFNALVDPVLIFTCSLGVTGAAVATALAEVALPI